MTTETHPTVLVTGGCGFIGRNLIERLVSRGYYVRILDNLSVGTPEALQEQDVELITGDIRDRETVRQAVANMAAVIHLAAHTDVRESVTQPDVDSDINVKGMLTLLMACRDEGIQRFVFASSNAPLGEQIPPVHEEQIPHPLSPYGASKLAGEALCQAFNASYGLPTVILRFANVYGPGSTHKSSVVAKFIRRMLRGETVQIYGDGRQTRDFVYIGDICRALILATESVQAANQLFQIGSGTETSILEFVELLKQVAGREEMAVEFTATLPGEIRRNYSSIDKARREMGYTPQTPLSEGLERTYQWFLHQA